MECSNRHIPTLVQLCQRVAGAHVDYIFNLGDELQYSLVQPILARCNPEQLLRLEQSSPRLQKDTLHIWKDLCFQTYPIAMERYSRGHPDLEDEPESWKNQFFNLCEEEAKRLEEAGNKLRNQRLEAEERKREREVKFTDRVPPSKRARTSGWGNNPQPKSLFQKTKSDASRLQKNMYHSRIIPPMPSSGKNFRVLTKPPGAMMPILPPSTNTSRVTVNTVVHRRPPTTPGHPPTPGSSSASKSFSTVFPQAHTPTSTVAKPSPLSGSLPAVGGPSGSKPPLSSLTSPVRPDRLPKLPPSTKKDPMASLFVPKHRAYSQRPV